MDDVDQHLQEVMFRFLSQHFAPEIVRQVSSQLQLGGVVTVRLSFDLSLMYSTILSYSSQISIEQHPQLGLLIYNDYPTFLKMFPYAIYRVINSVDSSKLKVDIDQINSLATFIKVPKLESPLQDYGYQKCLLNRYTGTLLHLKRVIVAKVFQRQEYLRHQFFRCPCRQELFLKVNELISLLKRNPANLKNSTDQNPKCKKCNSTLTEVISKRRFEPCQRLLVHLHDLDSTNSKYQNLVREEKRQVVSIKYKQLVKETGNIAYTLDSNDPEAKFFQVSGCRYQMKGQLHVLHVVGEFVDRFAPGMEVYSLAYLDFFISKEVKQGHAVTVEAEPYLVGVTVEQFTSVLNKDFFQKLQSGFVLSNPSQAALFPINQGKEWMNQLKSAMQEAIQRTHSHFTHTRENSRLCFDAFETLELISQNVAANTLPPKSLFPLKIACLLSIFLQNYQNFAYYLCRSYEKKSNLLVRTLSDETAEGAVSDSTLHLCFIMEDSELIIDAIREITCGMEDVYFLPPDPDETTMDLLLLNLVKGGILIVRSYYGLKDYARKRLKQILRGNQVPMKAGEDLLYLKLACSVWMLVELQELTNKKKPDSLDPRTMATNDKFSEIKMHFDIVLDVSFSNNLLRGVKNDFYCAHMEKALEDVVKSDLDKTRLDQFALLTNKPKEQQSTAKKGVIEKARPELSVSSCYFISQKQDQLELLTLLGGNADFSQRILLFQRIDHDCEIFLQKYFFALRKHAAQTSKLLTTCFKIATASSLLRYYIYDASIDHQPFYSLLLLRHLKTQDKVPWGFADVFLSVLLTLESRVNILGPESAVFGVDPAKQESFLFNSANEFFTPKELSAKDVPQEDLKFEKFDVLYKKVLGLIC